MAETPQELARRAALWLREQDKKFSKPIRFSKFKTPWELDQLRLDWRDRKELIPAQVYGREIYLTGDSKVRAEKVPVVDIGDMLILQFIPAGDLDFVFKVYETFGRVMLTRYTDSELDMLIAYSNEMDKRIVQAANRLLANAVSDIFTGLRKEMGRRCGRRHILHWTHFCARVGISG